MRQSVLCGVAQIAQEWQGKYNERCRSVEAALDVSLDWCGGGFLESCSSSLQALAKPELLVAMRFGICFDRSSLQGLSADHPKVVQADEFAQIAGCLAVRLVSHRLRKFLDVVCGWPRRCVLFCSPDARVRDAALAAFKKDVEVFEGSMQEQPYPQVAAMRKRSIFHLPAVQQFVELCRSQQWVATEKLQLFARNANLRLVQTQVSEDGFNRQRTEEDRGRTKRVSDERSWKGKCLTPAKWVPSADRSSCARGYGVCVSEASAQASAFVV